MAADLGGTPAQFGVHTIHIDGVRQRVVCDMDHFGGGWTLLVFGTTNRTSNQWNISNILKRNEDFQNFWEEFSLLLFADSIRKTGIGSTFEVSQLMALLVFAFVIGKCVLLQAL